MHNRITHKPPPTFDNVYVGIDPNTGDGLRRYILGAHELWVQFDSSIPYVRQHALMVHFVRECF